MSTEEIAQEILQEFKIRNLNPDQPLTGVMLTLLIGKLNHGKLHLVNEANLSNAIQQLVCQGRIREVGDEQDYRLILI